MIYLEFSALLCFHLSFIPFLIYLLPSSLPPPLSTQNNEQYQQCYVGYYVISKFSSPILEVVISDAYRWQHLRNKTFGHLAALLKTVRPLKQ